MLLKYSIGLDVSSKDIKACIAVIDNQQAVKVKSSTTILNTKKGFEDLVKWITKWHTDSSVQLCICLEATGVYHENCSYYLNNLGYKVSIILPNKAKKYLQALGLKSKNDGIDAKGLAQMGAQQNLDQWQPMGTFYYELRVLTRQYQSLQECITAEKNRLHAVEHSAYQIKFEVVQIKKLIAFLEKQLEASKKEMERHIKSNPAMQKKFTEVCKIYGVSLLSCATIIAETGGFVLFKNYKQVVSYAGYDIVENQSGSSVGKTRISKKGNSKIRRILHMPSLVAIGKKNTPLHQLYERIYERTQIKMKAIVAVQKKLLITIYYIWKNDLVYDINYIQKEEQVNFSPLALKKPLKKPLKKVA